MMKLLPIEILDLVNSYDFNVDSYSIDTPRGCLL